MAHTYSTADKEWMARHVGVAHIIYRDAGDEITERVIQVTAVKRQRPDGRGPYLCGTCLLRYTETGSRAKSYREFDLKRVISIRRWDGQPLLAFTGRVLIPGTQAA